MYVLATLHITDSGYINSYCPYNPIFLMPTAYNSDSDSYLHIDWDTFIDTTVYLYVFTCVLAIFPYL